VLTSRTRVKPATERASSPLKHKLAPHPYTVSKPPRSPHLTKTKLRIVKAPSDALVMSAKARKKYPGPKRGGS
jgi:hypothetical protein